jgi:hypothetical protein
VVLCNSTLKYNHPRTPLYVTSFFGKAGLSVPKATDSQKTVTPAQKLSLNLVPIKDTGLM